MELLNQVTELTKKFFEEKFEPVLSEGQLQFNLAKFLEGEFKRVYVECPIYKKGVRRSADIVIFSEDEFMLLELKYKTAEWTENINGGLKLVKQSGQTQGVKGFYEDIEKIRLCGNDSLNGIFENSQFRCNGGLAIFCTNDKYYHEWKGKAWRDDERNPLKEVWKESSHTEFKYCIADNGKNPSFFKC